MAATLKCASLLALACLIAIPAQTATAQSYPNKPALAHIQIGKLRALGVTADTRSMVLPDVPTIAEAGVPGYEAASWLFVAAPATPRSIIDTLNATTGKILGTPDVRERLLKAGSVPSPASPEEISKRVAAAIEQFGRIARELGLKPV